MAISVFGFLTGFLTGGNGLCAEGSSSECFVYLVFSLASLSFGCLSIIFIGAAAWSAFKERKHWIPPRSLVLGALVLQLLVLLNKSFNFWGDISSKDDKLKSILSEVLPEGMDKLSMEFKLYRSSVNASIFIDNWVSVTGGRVSVCVLMGCLLPGVARPLSKNLWSDMAALIISSSVSLFHFSYETYIIAYDIIDHGDFDPVFVRGVVSNIIILVSMAIQVLLLVSAALASVSISQTISHKIPTLFSAQNFYTQFSWKKVEEQATKSLIVARTADPQYIMARSILNSSIAFVITICNGILFFLICPYMYLAFKGPEIFLDIWFLLSCAVIVMGSIVIYWRCITAVVYYPTSLRWKWSRLAQYFQIEDFWKRHLLDLIDRLNTHEEISGSSLQKLMIRLTRKIRFHKLLHVVYWLQMLAILMSKVCWLSSELLFSNKYLRKFLIGSGYDEFSHLYEKAAHKEILLGIGSNYEKYSEALVIIKGENPAGIWIANKKSIEEIKNQMNKGEEKGIRSNELVSVLKNNSSPDFSGERCAKPQNSLFVRMQVEKELDVRKCYWKMTAVSIIALIIELSSFTQDQAEADNTVHSVIEACSQAWSIMGVVEISDGQSIELSKAANKHFQNLKNSRKWLDYDLPTNRSVERTPAAAKAAIHNLVQRGTKIANEYQSRKWSEVIAGYSLHRLGANMNYQFNNNNVEEIMDALQSILADVMGSCTVKAVGVIMEDCKKHATLYDEETILKIAGVAGQVKGVTENVGWKLKWKADEETQSIKTSLVTDEHPAIIRYSTFQIG